MKASRRQLLEGAGAAFATTALAGPALSQAFSFTPNRRYPDPAVEILDPGFAKYRIYSSTLEQVATGMRWAEGPPEGQYVLVSDIPNNRIMKYSERQLHRLPQSLQLRQWQYAGSAGTPRYLRAFSHAPHHAYREGRQDHRAR